MEPAGGRGHGRDGAGAGGAGLRAGAGRAQPAGLAAIRRTGHRGRDPVLGGGQCAVESRQPRPSPEPDGADDRVRNDLRGVVWIFVGGALADRVRDGGTGVDGGGRDVVCVGASRSAIGNPDQTPDVMPIERASE